MRRVICAICSCCSVCGCMCMGVYMFDVLLCGDACILLFGGVLCVDSMRVFVEM